MVSADLHRPPDWASAVATQMNDWDLRELHMYHHSQFHDTNFVVSGETNAMIADYTDELDSKGYLPIWLREQQRFVVVDRQGFLAALYRVSTKLKKQLSGRTQPFPWLSAKLRN